MHSIQEALRACAKPEKVEVYRRFFKTGPGEYGEGDQFIGVTMPDTRKIAKQFVSIDREDLLPLLASPVHEDRMCALIVLTYQYAKTKNVQEQRKIVNFYLANRAASNNWDLIDCVVDRILGPWLIDKPKEILYRFAQSGSLWERRMAIIATFHFIKQKRFEETLKIVEMLMNDKHDLIHKASGWMLREIGKRNEKYLETFLQIHYKKMPRTMLRYAIERFSPGRRKQYLEGSL